MASLTNQEHIAWTPYCTSHYTVEHCKQLAKQLRDSKKYAAVKIGYYIKDNNGKRYAKVYIKRLPGTTSLSN